MHLNIGKGAIGEWGQILRQVANEIRESKIPHKFYWLLCGGNTDLDHRLGEAEGVFWMRVSQQACLTIAIEAEVLLSNLSVRTRGTQRRGLGPWIWFS